MSRDFPVTGLAETLRALDLLPDRLRTNGVRQMLSAMADPIIEEARLRVPRKSGKLAKAIRKGSPRKDEDGTFRIRIYVDERRENGFLGYFLENGVRPHWIKVPDAELAQVPQGRRRQSRATKMKNLNTGIRAGSLVINGNFVGPYVFHPGIARHPFLVPALDVRADDAIAAGGVKLKAFLEGVKTRTGYDALAGAASLDEAA